MKCEDIREQLLDLAGGSAPGAEQKQHLDACAGCAGKLAELRQTMALLDEWKAPETSPYFDARLRARLREEVKQARGVWGWLRSPAFLRPAAAAAFTLILAAGVSLYNYSGKATPGPAGGGSTTLAAQAAEGSAVADLQALDKNEDLLADFDLLDELAAEQHATVER